VIDEPTVRALHPPLRLDELGVGRHRFGVVVARTSAGAEIRMPVNVLVGPRSGARLVVIAGIHGDEHEGPAALLALGERLDPGALRGTLVLVPVANPPAFNTATRWNRHDGLNLNRVFPGEADGSITHRIARLLVDEVIPGADFVITIHGWTAGSLTVPYVEYTSGHETSQAARAGAVAFGLEYLEPLPLLPGRLMSTLAHLGIAACEVEIGGEGITLPERRVVGEEGVIGVLRHLGMLEGEVVPPAAQRDVARVSVIAASGGFLRRADDLRVGDGLEAGRQIATVCGLNGEPLEVLVSPAGGVLAMLRHAANVDPGDLVAAVFRP
jgi:predicted deacylase